MNKSTLLKSRSKQAMGQTQPPRREDWDHVRFARNIPANRISWVSFLNPTYKVDMHPKDSTQGEAGFSLLELIVVVLMIAILSAIAAPGWLAFVNRQRVAKVNDGVWSALQEAQQEAKRTQLSYSVSFRNPAGTLPQVAVYPTEDRAGQAINLANNSNTWKPLSQGLDIKPEQVTLCSNIDSSKANKKANNSDCSFTTARTITFDYQGNLGTVDGQDPDIGDGISITVAVPKSNGDPIESTARCVVVKTIIGSMALEQGDNCQQ
ncbi:pilus assembly FimT family protein [Coleofasciculus sp.]|uniref:pilus assembly FimT family protein n=1 Tax=Coleofasciculus sp. TaxID=3100458 RepID=UPI0039F9DD90